MSSVGELDIQLLRDFRRGAFTHALFDFDGTISLLREGWQDIMGPVMIEMITGGAPATPEIEREVAEYIDASTGIQTIVQMEHLVTMVREYGLVPERQIRSPREYKRVYNDRLMAPVSQRLAALRRGELTVEAATVRGSVPFVQALADAGLTMYIFSGTDREDVQIEAEALGVARYFREIWGALDTVEEYSKEKVLRELIEAYGLRGEQVLVIGDGPVELRNGKQYGCAALGVCSDEKRGHGWDEVKRARLTKAGADALLPDFERHAETAKWLLSAESEERTTTRGTSA